MSSVYKLIYDKKTDGGSFSMLAATITIGIRSVKTDPNYTFSVISHEIMEVVLCGMGCRYTNSRTQDNHLFTFNHMEFETAIRVHAQALSKFV